LLWATRSLVFRGGEPDALREPPRDAGEKKPFRAARQIDWVSWLAGIPEQLEEAACEAPNSDDAPTAVEMFETSSSGSLRVSLKIRHTI
jgi:hypothetical protein